MISDGVVVPEVLDSRSPSPRLLVVARRLSWGLTDQALSSLTNVALGILVARAVPTRTFGAFAIAFSVYTIALGGSRAPSTEPLVVRFSATSNDEWRRGVASATGAALLFGVVVGAGCIAAAFFFGGLIRLALMPLGITMPGLLLQDSWRFAFFAKSKGSYAFLNDFVWAIALFTAFGVLLHHGHPSVGQLIFWWGAAGTIAGVVGVAQSMVLPAPQRTLSWLRDQWDLAPRFVGDFAVATLISQVSLFAVGAFAGLSEAGGFRGAQLLLGPLNVVFVGVAMVALPEAVGILQASPSKLQRACTVLSVSMAACAGVWGIGAFLIPSRLGVQFLGHSWNLAHGLVIPTMFIQAGVGVIAGAGLGMRALANARRGLLARIIMAPVSLAGGLGGAAVFGARGAAWGLAISFVWGGLVWWRQFVRALAEHQAALELVPQVVL
jgi:O-antigen/teichoic acid export membrane protein